MPASPDASRIVLDTLGKLTSAAMAYSGPVSIVPAFTEWMR
jgi:hypothetical protein